MSAVETVKQYVDKAIWEVKENANTQYSFAGLQLMLAETAIKEYMLTEIYIDEIKEAYDKGYFHIHDLGMGNICYCMGHDLQQIVDEGFNGVVGKVSAKPPKHLRTAINQVINYLFCNQSENAGAQAINNMDTLLAPYVKADGDDYKEVKQCIQEFIYTMNVPTRVGMQAPFSNVTFDLKCPEHFKNLNPRIGGEKVAFTYGECNEEIGMIAKAFFEIMMEGDARGKPFTFPIPTINLHKDFVWDDDVAKTIFQATAKYGTPNFQNLINSDIDPEDLYSMCCRLSIDKKQLLKNSGGIFGSSSKTGAIGVVTINLPRLAFEAKTKKKLLHMIKLYMSIAKDSLEIKREHIKKNLDRNLVPYTKRYIGHFDNHFSTIGLVGGNEMCMNLINKDLSTKEGQELMEEVLAFMENMVSQCQEETGNYYNLEQTPAESTCYKLAKNDRKAHPDIITAGTVENPYYTNSSHLHVGHKMSIFKMLKVQETFNKYYNGGTIVHVFLGQKVTDWINCMMLVKRIAESTTLAFFTVTPTFSICPIHGYISGTHKYCPLSHGEEDLKRFGIYEQKQEQKLEDDEE
ncbi:MAG: ribonucleoside triphosphate reductase [Candidatus Peribacteraceae bacterium]|nr:ribonucleoside triphosphate reductase [Candidatus Peribacteraceae bacterium]